MLVGTITDTDPLRVKRVYGTGQELRVTIVGYDGSVSTGERLAVYGVAEPNHQIRAMNGYTIPRTNYVSMYLISFVAGLWALTRISRGWRLNRAELALEPRDEPLDLSSVLGGLSRTEDGGDA